VRIAAVNSFGQIVGGVERYLDSSIPLLLDAEYSAARHLQMVTGILETVQHQHA
jgi:hypothetical protein